MFYHILVPLDGSTRAEAALPVAARLACASSGTLTVLRVVTDVVDMDLRPVQLARRAELAQEADVARAQELPRAGDLLCSSLSMALYRPRRRLSRPCSSHRVAGGSRTW
jgi:nucleotide-binding universal stress UspA family protein